MLCSKVIIEQKMADLELAILRQEELIKSQREVISSLKELLYSEIYKVWPPAPQVTNPPINPNTTTYQSNEQNKTYSSSPQIPPPAAPSTNGQLSEDNLPFSTSFLSTINPIEPVVQSKKRRSPLTTDNQTKPNELSNPNNQNKVLISGPVSSTTNDTRKKAKVSTPPPEDQIPKTLQLQNPQPALTTSSVTASAPVRLSIHLPPKSKNVSAIKRRALEKTNQFVSTIPKFTMYKYSSSTPISSSKTTSKPENNNNNNINNYNPVNNGNPSSNELNYTTPLPNASKRKATSSNSKALLNNTTSPFVSLTDVDEEYPILPSITTSDLNNKPKIPSPPHNNNNLQRQMNDYYEELKSKLTFVDRVNAIKDFDKQLNNLKHKEFSKNLLDDQGKFLLTNWLSDIDLDIKPDRDTGDFIKSTLYLLNIAHWTAKDVVLVRVDKTIRKIYKKFSNYRNVLGDETLNLLREIWSKFRYLYQESNERGPNLDIDG